MNLAGVGDGLIWHPACWLSFAAVSLNSALYFWIFPGPDRGIDTPVSESVYKTEASNRRQQQLPVR